MGKNPPSIPARLTQKVSKSKSQTQRYFKL